MIAALIAGSGAAQPRTPADPARLVESADSALAANKKLVLECSRELWQARALERAAACLGEGFVEHGADAPAGRVSYVRYLAALPKRTMEPTADDLETITAERDLVVLGFRRRAPNPAEEGQTLVETWFDVYRIENGRIAERWTYAPRD